MSLLVKAGGGTSGIQYTGDNPLTIGQDGYVFDPKTLLKDGLQIINGVSGEDYTDTASRQTTSVDTLLREVKRKVADHKGEGEFVWKKYEYLLPSGYTQLESIASSGTQYIDSGYSIGASNGTNIKIEANVAYLGTSGWQTDGFSCGNSDAVYFGLHTNRWVTSNGYPDGLPTFVVGTRYSIIFDTSAGIMSVDGISGTWSPLTPNTSYNFLIFAQTTASSITYHSKRVYSYKIYDSGVLVRDYVPCINPNGEVGLYDAVNNIFYGNSGTGTFVAGEAVAIEKTFLDYIVSSDSEAYPDGGEQDGFWYEKVVEGTEYGMFINEADSEGYPLDVVFRFSTMFVGMFYSYSGGGAETVYQNCKNILIESSNIPTNAFRNALTMFTGKLKIKTKSMAMNAFNGINSTSKGNARIWISKECETVGDLAFAVFGTNTSMYCEATSKPSGWSGIWNKYNGSSSSLITTTWGVTEEQFDAL